MNIRWLPVADVVLGLLLATSIPADAFDVFRYEEATIADIHAAFKAKALTCRALVQMYLDRIEAYDKKGPALNAIVVTNPEALKVADALGLHGRATVGEEVRLQRRVRGALGPVWLDK